MKKTTTVLIGAAVMLSLSAPAFADTPSAVKSDHKVIINGALADLTGYNIGGRNYFQLAELGKIAGFQVQWDAATKTVTIVTESSSVSALPAPPPSAPATPAPAENVSLEMWDGTWNNVVPFLENKDALRVAMRLKARENMLEKKPDVTYDQVKDSMMKRRALPFNSCVIEKGKITFYDTVQKPGEASTGKVLGSGEYKYVGTAKDANGYDFEKFEATNSEALYRHLILMAPHHDEALVHFHGRFGNESFESLLAETGWPLLMDAKSTLEQLRQEIAKPELKLWEGTWNSIRTEMTDKRFDKTWEEAAAAKNTTVDALKKERTAIFTEEFKSIVIQGNHIAFYDNLAGKGSVLAEGKYKIEGYSTEGDKSSFIQLIAEGDATYKYILLIPVHMDKEGSLIHFHLRYGNDLKSLLEAKDWPTAISLDSTDQQLSGEIQD